MITNLAQSQVFAPLFIMGVQAIRRQNAFVTLVIKDSNRLKILVGREQGNMMLACNCGDKQVELREHFTGRTQLVKNLCFSYPGKRMGDWCREDISSRIGSGTCFHCRPADLFQVSQRAID